MKTRWSTYTAYSDRTLVARRLKAQGFKVFLWSNSLRITLEGNPSRMSFALLQVPFFGKYNDVQTQFPDPSNTTLAKEA
mgnify:FL=1